MRRIILVLSVAGAIFCSTVGNAAAAFGVHPNNETTSPQPTFTIYAGSDEINLTTLYVSTDGQMDSSFYPTNYLASCFSFVPTSVVNNYTCQPSSYGGRSALAPGTYYWWLTYYTSKDFVKHIAGPMAFTVAAPQAPVGVTLLSPTDGARVSGSPSVRVHLPSGVHVDFWIADSNNQSPDDGSPASYDDEAHCAADISSDGDYNCAVDGGKLFAGTTYYWWAVVSSGGFFWIYGPRSFTYGAVNGGGGGGGGGRVHDLDYAPALASSPHFTGRSVKQTKLSQAAYSLSKAIGAPKSIAVACWSEIDWENISGDNPESAYSTLGFWKPTMPHWLHLSPGICRTMETLIYKRPQFANRFTANAVDTLTHEMLHGLGVRNEAQTECYAMQLNWVTANRLGVPLRYSYSLSRLSLGNYGFHPPAYQDRSACREDGIWDLFKRVPSLPWHDFQV
jgi:hypothetical protein